MSRKSFKKHQKLYKMKGCSKKNKSRRHLAGGSNPFMAYTGTPLHTQSNPFLAYTGTGRGSTGGGSSVADNIRLPSAVDVMSPNSMSRLYGGNPALPNTGPVSLYKSTIPTNMGSMKFGGSSCGSCNSPLMTGGSCGACSNVAMTGGTCASCNSPLMTGGSCGCNLLKGGNNKQKGGQTIDPQGLVGSPWTSRPSTWPGVDSVDGNRNYLAHNGFKSDPQTALISLGANRPFLFGGRKHTSSGGIKTKGKRRRKRLTKKRRQKGGTTSNLLSQDLINLGRQIQYNMGSTYNAFNGYSPPTPVLPWQGQLPRTPNLNTMRGNAL
jgi:hypothetical protein